MPSVQILQNYMAPVGFLPEPDFCRIWKKCRILAGAGTALLITYLQHIVVLFLSRYPTVAESSQYISLTTTTCIVYSKLTN